MNPRLAVAALALALPLAGQAQVWRYSPSITLSETWSDNARLLPDATAQAGWITVVSPAISLEHRGPLLRISADYRYQHDFYTGSSGDTSRNFLGAFGSYDFIQRRLWVEGRANITQERLSAFGSSVIPDAPGANANRIETRSLGFSPVLRGSWGEFADYSARANVTASRAGGYADVDTSEVVATVRSGAPSARFSWAADASGLSTTSDDFGTLQDLRARLSFIYAPVPQVHVSLIAGYEDTDFAPEGEQRQSTPGVGLEWSPGPRTQFAGVAQRRFFGTGHLATLRHRTARTAWELRSRREATTSWTSISGGALTLNSLMSDLLAASIPDPVARAEAVRRRLEEFGSAPTSISAGFLTERPYLVDGMDGRFAYIGVRSTLALGFRNETQKALLSAPLAGDSFAESSEIRVRGYSVGWTHRMTRLTNLTIASARLRHVGLDANAPSTNEELDTVFLSTRLGPRTTASLGVRRVDFESTQQSSYREKAVFASVSFRL